MPPHIVLQVPTFNELFDSFHSLPFQQDLLARMMAAEEQKRNVLKDLSRRIFEKFSAKYSLWESAVQCVAILDVLLALAEFARQQSGEVCLPEITFDNDKVSFFYFS